MANDIFVLGWDWSKVLGGICILDDDTHYIQKFNDEVVASSSTLAPVGTIQAGTLTNSHTVQMLRCISSGTVSENPLLSSDGKYNMALIQQTRPDMVKAASEGWLWTVLHHDAYKLYGEKLLETLSTVKNVTVQRREHEIEVLNKIAKLVQRSSSIESIDWTDLQRQVCQSKPECVAWVPSMTSYLKKYGGGHPCHFVSELVDFHRRFVAGHNQLGGQFWQHIAELTVKVNSIVDPVPLLRLAIIKTEMSSPNQYGKYITKSDIDSLSKKLAANAVDANKLLIECRKLAEEQSAGVEPAIMKKMLGVLDCTVVRVLLKKKATDAKTVEAAASKFAQTLAGAAGKAVKDKWAVPDASTKPSGASAVGPEHVAEYSATGELVKGQATTLQSMGFEIGTMIAEKKVRTKPFKIDKIKGDDVTLLDVASKEKLTMKIEALRNGWIKFEDEVLVINNESLRMHVCKAGVMHTIGSMADMVGSPVVEIHNKPVRKVVAKKSYKVGSLMLIPETTSMTLVKEGDKKPNSMTKIGTIDGFVAYGSQPPTKSMVSPFWCGPSVGDCNMELKEVAITVACNKSTEVPGKTVKKSIDIVTLVNCVDVHVGDELCLKENEPAAKKARRGVSNPYLSGCIAMQSTIHR